MIARQRHETYKGTVAALSNISIEIAKGDFVFLVGPSGSGKTTFLRLLLREELPESGPDLGCWTRHRRAHPRSSAYLRRNLGCVFQDFRLLPNKTVAENVAFVLEVIGRSRTVVRSQVSQVLDLVGLGQRPNGFPASSPAVSSSESPSPERS